VRRFRHGVVLLASAAMVATAQTQAGAGVDAQTSSVWTGFVANLPPAPSIVSIEGSFTVPALSCPRFGTSAVSIWVGVGVADPTSSSPRVGVTGTCQAGVPSYTAWTQWVDPTRPTRRDPIPYFTPEAGATMHLNIDAMPFGHVLTEPVLVLPSGYREESYINMFPADVDTPPIKGASVGCVVERPRDASGPLPLANFGTISWAMCSSWAQYPTTTELFGLSSGREYDQYGNLEPGAGFVSDDVTMKTSDGKTLATSAFSRDAFYDPVDGGDTPERGGSFVVTWKASDSLLERTQRLCRAQLPVGGDTVCAIPGQPAVGGSIQHAIRPSG